MTRRSWSDLSDRRKTAILVLASIQTTGFDQSRPDSVLGSSPIDHATTAARLVRTGQRRRRTRSRGSARSARTWCQSTPRWRASAETVVSSWVSASVAHRTARTVNTARGGARACSSLNVALGQAGSRQRQIRFSQRTNGTPAEAGCVMRNVHPAPVADREHSAAWAAVLDLVGLHRHHQPVLLIHRDGENVQVNNIEHRIGPGAHPNHTQGGPPSGLSVGVLGRLRS